MDDARRARAIAEQTPGRMRTSAPARDTSDAAAAAHLLALRRLGPAGRLAAGLRSSAAMIARSRASLRARGPGARTIWVASAEDTVLVKLEWFRRGGQVSERQWHDVQGVLRLSAADIDTSYLRRWAPSLGVADLLERALTEAAG